LYIRRSYTEVEFTDPHDGGTSTGITGVNPVLVCDSIDNIYAEDLFANATFPLSFDKIAAIWEIEVSTPQLNNVVADRDAVICFR
jgi:hypothetical protein